MLALPGGPINHHWTKNLIASGSHRISASGLRNPVGLAWELQRGALRTAVNEGDELGNDFVPDYLTAVQDGAFYGWLYSYFSQHVDARVAPQRPDLVALAKVWGWTRPTLPWC